MCFPFVSAKIRFSFGSCKLFFRNLRAPYLYAVDDVLPENVASGAYGGEWREVGAGYPDGEGGVLLSESLPGVNGLAEASADGSAAGELEDAEQERTGGDEEQEAERGVGVEDVLHRGAGDDEQRASPEIVGEVFDADDALAEALGVMLHDVGEQHRHDEHREHLI